MSLHFLGFISLIIIEYMGLAGMIPVLHAVKAPLILALSLFAYVVLKYGSQLNYLFRSVQFRIFMIYIFWTAASVFYALIAWRAYNMLIVQTGDFILFVVAYVLFKEHKNMRRFMLLSLAMHFVLVIMNLDILTSGVRTGSLRAGYFLGDGNDFGWSLVIYLPFTFYLMTEYRSLWLRCITACFGSTVFIGVILTGSRGASVAVFASIMYLVVKSKKKVFALAVIVIAIFLVWAVAPPTYFERIHSITDAGEDSSTRGRLMAWKAATQMAIDYPLGIGAGNFPSVYGRYYRDTFADQTVYAPNRWISVHSIYFLILAEYGLGGLLLLLYLLYKMFKQNSESETTMIGQEKKNTQPWLPIALKASIIALSVDGIFLGGVNYPHIYLLAAMTLATREVTENMQAVECQ